MSYQPQFIQLLNQYLQEQDRSASWLAKRLKVSPSTVNRWQNGVRRPGKPEIIIKMADALGVYDQSKRQELLVAAGYGYQPPASEPPKPPSPSESQVPKVAEVANQAEVANAEVAQVAQVAQTAQVANQDSPTVAASSSRDEGEVTTTSSSGVPGLSGNRLQLKPALEQLVGVEAHLTRLERVLLSAAPPWVVSIEGIGGIGKTSLAKALVHRVVEEKAEGKKFKRFCWVSVQPQLPSEVNQVFNRNQGIIKPALTVRALLDELVRQLLGSVYPSLPTEGTPGTRSALSSEDALLLLRHHLTEHPHLIVIDNLGTLTDAQNLLPTLRYLAAPTKFLLTLRESLFNEADVYPFRVPELSQQNALVFVREQAKLRNLPHLLECDDEVLKPIYDTVGGNPMALRLVVGQTYIHHLSVVLSDLAAARGEKAVNLYTHIYHRAWDHLDEVTRHLFLVMPLVTSQGGSLDYIKHVSQLEPHVLRKSLGLLVSLNLIDVQRDLSAWRYTIHQLTRTFLQEQVAQWLSSSAESDTDIQTSMPASLMLFQTYIKRSAEYVLTHAQQATTSLPLEHRQQALHTLGFAYEVNSFASAAIWPVVCNLLIAIAPKMEQAGHREEWMTYLEHGIQQSLKLRDIETQAELRFHLGVLHHHQAEFDEAHRQFESSAAHFAQLGQPSRQARALNRLASVARRQQRFEQASSLAHRALAFAHEAKEEMGYSHFVLGAIALDQREWQKAIDSYEKSLALWEEGGNQRLIAWGLGNLGKALRKLERYAEAITCYEKAIKLFEAIQDPFYQAVARMNLGNVYVKLEQPQKALDLYVLAEATFDKMFARLSLAQIYFNKGQAYEQLQAWDKAEEAYLASLTRWQQIGTISSVVNVMVQLGVVYLAQKRTDKTIEVYEDALSKLTEVKNEAIHQHLSTLLTTHLDEAIESG